MSYDTNIQNEEMKKFDYTQKLYKIYIYNMPQICNYIQNKMESV